MADPAIEAAARAYCSTKFTYDPTNYVSPSGAADHLTNDARSMTNAPWLVAVVAAVRPIVIRECAEAIERANEREHVTPPRAAGPAWVRGFITGNTKALHAVRGLAGEAT